VLMALAGLSGDKAFFFYAGASLIPFGAAQILRYIGVPSRPVLSVVGLYILALWLLPENIAEKIWGELDGDIEMFFLSGIFMVVGATILTMQNTDYLLAGVSKLGGLFKGTLPAVRTAVAYPSAARGRTSMTIAMFSLIVFSLVMMATMNANFGGDKDANAGWDIVASVQSEEAIPNLTADLEAAGVDTSGYDATGVTTNPSIFSSEIKLPEGDEWKLWPVIGMDSAFIDNSILKFQQRAEGYASDEDIIQALKTQPDLAVIDSFAIPQGGLGGGSDSAFELTGLTTDDDTFAPITVDLAAQNGSVSQVTIIGIIDEQISSLNGMYASQATIDSIYPTLTSSSYFVSLTDPDRSDATSKAIEAALLQRGVQVTSIHDQLKDAEKEQTGFLYLIEGFMGLGLLVGVAAVGVIAFRSVVERRQQIGVLRALGFQRSLVSLGFLIETGFVVGIGMLTGTVLGLLLSRNLLAGDSTGSPVENFTVPWTLIIVILFATVAAAMSMTWLPSRQASRIAPAEALRYE
jgi:putative ABC transport system permease protein